MVLWCFVLIPHRGSPYSKFLGHDLRNPSTREFSSKHSRTWVPEVSDGRFCRDPLYGGLDLIRMEAWPFYRTLSGVRLCWELEEPKGPNGWAPSLQVR